LPIIDATRYSVDREVARGGLGRILSAHDRRLRRSIALKQALPERPEAGALLLQEALTTARLQHPGIVPVYDAGYFADGSPFYAMKLIDGRTLTSCIARCATLADRLALLPNVIAVADAIAYAHSQGVVHRDVKPANVLVGAFGETQVVDWGIACAVEPPPPPREHGRTVARGTFSGVVVGTPAYMAPEQARGEPVDERVDVYALGAMLYHLLTGVPPYDGHDGKDAASLLTELRAGPPTPLARRGHEIPGELVTIVEKAMARERDARYPRAAQLADDLKRFQTGQLVSVHRYTFGALLGRWLRRHRVTVAVAAVLLGVLAVTSAISLAHIIEGRRREAARAEQLTLEHARSLVGRDPTATIAWLKRLRLTDANAGTAWVLAQAARSHGLSTEVWRGHRAPIADLGVSPDGRLAATAGLDWDVRLRDLETGQERVLEGHRGLVVAVAWSSDGATLASASEDGTLRLWTRAGAPLASFVAHAGKAVLAVAFLPDGHAVASVGYDGTLRLHDPHGQELRAFTAEDRRLVALAVAPDGAELAAGGSDGRVWLWRADGSRTLVLADASWGQVSQLAFSPGGTRLAAAHETRGVALWDVATGTLTGEHPRAGGASRLAFAAAGDALYAAGTRGEVERWDLGTHQTATYAALDGPVTDLRVSRDPAALVVATERQLALWNPASDAWTLLLGHEGAVNRVAFVPGGRLLSAGADGSLRRWSATAAVHGPPRDESAAVIVAFSPDGTQLATGSEAGRVRVTTLDPEVETRRLEAGAGIADLAYSPDGKRLVLASAEHLVAVDLGDGRQRRLDGPSAEIVDLEIAPTGEFVVAAAFDGALWIWDLASGQGRALPARGGVTQVAIAPDGRSFASASFDGSVRLWDVATGSVRELGRHEGRVYALAYAPDGRHLATGGQDNLVRLWTPGDAKDPGRVIASHRGKVTLVVFSPDSGQVASAGYGEGIVVSQLDGRSRSVPGHHGRVRGLVWSPDGLRLASCSDLEGSVHIVDVASGEAQALGGAPERPLYLAFAPGGRHLGVAGADGTVRLWDLAAATQPAALAAWLATLTRATIDPGAPLASR
jgi:WD40 repeat protein